METEVNKYTHFFLHRCIKKKNETPPRRRPHQYLPMIRENFKLISSSLFDILPKWKRIINILLFGRSCRLLEKWHLKIKQQAKHQQRNVIPDSSQKQEAEVDTRKKENKKTKEKKVYILASLSNIWVLSTVPA